MSHAKDNKETGQRKDMSVLSKAYLLLYNGVQTVGWGYMFVQSLHFLATKQTHVGLWKECGLNVAIFQSLAGLEVLHCIIKIVPSSALVTFLQIASRVFMVWGVLVPVREAQSSPTLPVMLIAWGITEVIRYSYYFFNLLGIPPKPLTWCRYSFFMGLYPAGIIGELGCVYYALDVIKRKRTFSLLLPNRFNISFNYYYVCILVMASYAPIFPQLFMHMVHQRKKMLGSPKTESGVPKKLE